MSSKTAYAFDTEFIEDGRTIKLISIGIVCEDGREYYAVNSDMPVKRIRDHPWLMKNVVPSLPLLDGKVQHTPFGSTYFNLDRSSTLVKPKWVIANEVRDFLVGSLSPAGEHEGRPFYFDTDLPELWADHAAYDHVVLAQLWGTMIDLPDGIPMFTHEIQQELQRAPDGFERPAQTEGHHNALEDARHNMRVLMALRESRIA